MNQDITKPLALAYEQFGFALLDKLTETGIAENMLISPLSIAIALSLTYNGAKNESARLMARALGIEQLSLAQLNQANQTLLESLEQQTEQLQINLANAVWVSDRITMREDFETRLKDFYRSETGNLDFSQDSAAETINRWVAQKTAKKIKNLVSPELLENVLLLLVNAVYFKGAWSAPFNLDATKEQPFTLTDGTTKRHPMRCVEQANITTAKRTYFSLFGFPT